MALITTKQWIVSRNDKVFDGLKRHEVMVPQVGETEVLVKLNAAALNHRDLVIAKVLKTANSFVMRVLLTNFLRALTLTPTNSPWFRSLTARARSSPSAPRSDSSSRATGWPLCSSSGACTAQ